MRRDAELGLEDEQRRGRVGASITVSESHWQRFVNWFRGRRPYEPRTFEAPKSERCARCRHRRDQHSEGGLCFRCTNLNGLHHFSEERTA